MCTPPLVDAAFKEVSEEEDRTPHQSVKVSEGDASPKPGHRRDSTIRDIADWLMTNQSNTRNGPFDGEEVKVPLED